MILDWFAGPALMFALAWLLLPDLGRRYLDWELTDPAGLTIEQIRPIRDEIGRRVQTLLAELLASRPE